MSENRKPVVVATVFALVFVVAFVVATGFGGRGTDSGAGWLDALSDSGGSSSLRPDDLELLDGACKVSSSIIMVTGSCVLEVAGFGGGFSLGHVVKKATIVPHGPMRLTVVVEGTKVSKNIDKGDETQLTFGTSGGKLGLACLASDDLPCSVGIGQ